MECPVCFEIYRTPLLLPGCGHTICLACAELLISEGNYLRCPECRLCYQLRKGVKSLPKNVALQRTIDEHNESTSASSARSRGNVMCDDHPDDAVSLYCKTCEKSICLKCYFSNTLRRGQTMHTGHQVDTSEDAHGKEKRMLEELASECEGKRLQESEYIANLEEVEAKLNEILTSKLEEIEKQKNDVMTQAKQTSGKLKFTLKGSVAREVEFLQMALQSSRDRLEGLQQVVVEAQDVLKKDAGESVQINTIKECRKRLEALPSSFETDRPDIDSFLKVKQFDTDLRSCLNDQKRALSYQTEPPRTPSLNEDCVIVSDTKAYLEIRYNEVVRVKTITLYYKEAMYKGLCEKEWSKVSITDLSKGVACHKLEGLDRGTLYRLYVEAANECGQSDHSNELWFRTASTELEKRVT